LVRLVQLDSNTGPNPARNLGIRAAETPFVLLVDDDVELQPDTVSRLRAAFDGDPSIAITTPVILYGAQPDTIQYAGTGVHFLCEGSTRWQDHALSERGSDPADLGCAAGCSYLVSRRAAMSVGLFDERYFFGKTDGEFTYRIRLAGYRIVEVPQARVLHHASPRGSRFFYYQIRNRWHFMLKNYEARTLLALAPILLVHELLQGALLLYKGFGPVYLKAMWGLIKMLPDLPADRAAVRAYRAQADRDVLFGGSLVVRDDFANNAVLSRAKDIYDSILNWYWRAVKRTVLR
jgi:hypothetical protein